MNKKKILQRLAAICLWGGMSMPWAVGAAGLSEADSHFLQAAAAADAFQVQAAGCLLYTSPSPRDVEESRMPSSA